MRRRWLIIGLAVFLLIDAVLIVLALTANRPAGTAGETPAAKPTVEATETTAPTAEPTAPPEAQPAVAPTRVLAALDGTTAWRASAGACPATQATAELTTDAGATWVPSNASTDTGASAILSINAIDADEASMVTLAAPDCAPQLVGTFVAGAQWAAYPDRLGANWYVNPADRATVNSPAGSFPAPCASVIAVAPRSDTVAGVLCAEGAVVRTGDGGATWGPPIAAPGAVHLSVTGEGYILLAANQPNCAGAQVSSTTEAPDGAITPVGCREAAFNPGEAVIASAGDTVWLWAGETVSKSTDGGATWQ